MSKTQIKDLTPNEISGYLKVKKWNSQRSKARMDKWFEEFSNLFQIIYTAIIAILTGLAFLSLMLWVALTGKGHFWIIVLLIYVYGCVFMELFTLLGIQLMRRKNE